MDVKGFSLAEMMVAVGMLGVVTLGTIKLTKNSLQSQKRLEASSAGQMLFHTLSQQLLNSDACKNTLKAVEAISNGTQINEIKNRKNDVIYKIGEIYSNRSVKIESITVQDLDDTLGATPVFSDFNLEIKLLRMSSEISEGTKSVVHKIPMQAEIKDGKVEHCYALTDNAVATAKLEVCHNLKGTYNKENDSCDLKHYAKECPDGTNLIGFDANGDLKCKEKEKKILAQYSRISDSERKINHTFTIDKPGILIGVANGVSNYLTRGGSQQAGGYSNFLVDGASCGADMAFEGFSHKMTFYMSATCIKLLSPGTHTVTSWLDFHYNEVVSSNRLDYVVLDYDNY